MSRFAWALFVVACAGEAPPPGAEPGAVPPPPSPPPGEPPPSVVHASFVGERTTLPAWLGTSGRLAWLHQADCEVVLRVVAPPYAALERELDLRGVSCGAAPPVLSASADGTHAVASVGDDLLWLRFGRGADAAIEVRRIERAGPSGAVAVSEDGRVVLRELQLGEGDPGADAAGNRPARRARQAVFALTRAAAGWEVAPLDATGTGPDQGLLGLAADGATAWLALAEPPASSPVTTGGPSPERRPARFTAAPSWHEAARAPVAGRLYPGGSGRHVALVPPAGRPPQVVDLADGAEIADVAEITDVADVAEITATRASALDPAAADGPPRALALSPDGRWAAWQASAGAGNERPPELRVARREGAAWGEATRRPTPSDARALAVDDAGRIVALAGARAATPEAGAATPEAGAEALLLFTPADAAGAPPVDLAGLASPGPRLAVDLTVRPPGPSSATLLAQAPGLRGEGAVLGGALGERTSLCAAGLEGLAGEATLRFQVRDGVVTAPAAEVTGPLGPAQPCLARAAGEARFTAGLDLDEAWVRYRLEGPRSAPGACATSWAGRTPTGAPTACPTGDTRWSNVSATDRTCQSDTDCDLVSAGACLHLAVARSSAATYRAEAPCPTACEAPPPRVRCIEHCCVEAPT